MSGDESQIQCYKEQYHIGTWNVRSMNQGKLDVTQQEMARVNINKWTKISELKWMGMGEFNSSTTVGKDSIEGRLKWSRSVVSNPMDCSLPGSSVHGIFQARILKRLPFPTQIEEISSSQNQQKSLKCSAHKKWCNLKKMTEWSWLLFKANHSTSL